MKTTVDVEIEKAVENSKRRNRFSVVVRKGQKYVTFDFPDFRRTSAYIQRELGRKNGKSVPEYYVTPEGDMKKAVRKRDEESAAEDQPKKWIYKSTAIKEFRVTNNQIGLAIKNGLVEARAVKNPNYKSGPPATLVSRSDLEANLRKVKSYPKPGESEKESRRIYSERKKSRDELQFFCPRCREKVRALRESAMFESFFTGDATLEEAKEALMVAHYRHAHTDYEQELELLNNDRYSEYQELRKKGKDFDEAWEKVDEQNSEDYESETDVKRQYNVEARKLLEKDGLLCRKRLDAK